MYAGGGTRDNALQRPWAADRCARRSLRTACGIDRLLSRLRKSDCRIVFGGALRSGATGAYRMLIVSQAEPELETVESLQSRVDTELARISDPRIAERVAALRVVPEPQERAWDYGAPGETMVCWIVLKHEEVGLAIAYCEEGFGPQRPWGLLWLTGPYMSMGMDTSWYESLEAAYRESLMCEAPGG